MRKIFAIVCLTQVALLLIIGCGQKKEEPQSEPMIEETTTLEDTTSTMMMEDTTGTLMDSTVVPDTTAVKEAMGEGGH